VPQSPASTATQILWQHVTDERLEALLNGLLEALGASSLVWRAGSASGVNASDGGRDLEAVFDRPTPDGDLDRQRWWIESKGRSGTVEKDAVQKAVLDAAARPDIDVLVIATNSRFTNPTRDWLDQWRIAHPRPQVRLWDRDRLDSLVRKYPTVAARSLPQALDDKDRLKLLLERLQHLGELPHEDDLQYFWQRQSVVKEAEDSVATLAMLVVAEPSPNSLTARPWVTLLTDDDAELLIAFVLISMPAWLDDALARPVPMDQWMRGAVYLLLGAMPRLREQALSEVITNPYSLLTGEPWDRLASSKKSVRVLLKAVTLPILRQAQDDLALICADDCVRVIVAESDHDKPLVGKHYWRRFSDGEQLDDRRLIMEQNGKPCAVGFPVGKKTSCPLINEALPAEGLALALKRVVEFRIAHPEGQYLRLKDVPAV
jgi:hypothetical protein